MVRRSRFSAHGAAAVSLWVIASIATSPAHGQGAPDAETKSTEEIVENANSIFRSLTTSQVRAFVRPKDGQAVSREDPDVKKNKEVQDALAAVGAYLDLAEKEEAERKGLKGTFKFGAGSDEAGATEKSKANVGAELAIGTYPHQLRFKVDASVQYENSAVKEDVTSMLVNYDYYIRPGHEAFGFIERFTDSFLNINQRYEVGLGMKLEYTRKASYESKPLFEEVAAVRYLPPLETAPQPPDELQPAACEKLRSAQDCKALLDAWRIQHPAPSYAEQLAKVCKRHIADEKTCSVIVANATGPTTTTGVSRPVFDSKECRRAYTVEGCEKMAALLKARSEAADGVTVLSQPDTVDPAFEDTVKKLATAVQKIELADILNARRKAYTRLEAGVAFGALAEFENPAALTRAVQTLDSNGVVLTSESRALPQPATQRFRLSVRPSIKLRLGERTELEAKVYFKPALDSPREVDGKRDYRVDAYAGLAWAFPKISPNGKPPKVSLNYELHYDSLPPNPLAALSANEQLDPAGPQGSEKQHRIIKLAVEIAL
jgi:hypothetical protein